jgi:hypothetical protein
MRRLWCILALFFCLAACSREEIPSVARENLFSLDIGRMEDQIALYNIEGDRGLRRAALAMRDGLCYISDGNGGKIVRYNSYGDILFMIYNEETNPLPLTLKPPPKDGILTRWAFPYPLLEPGEIAVDSRKHIYVRDRLPYERHGFDPDNRALLDSALLHFDGEGRFVNYLGREGIGGSPFPRIERIFTSADDEIAVVCRVSSGWNVYWFDSGGKLLFLVRLANEAVPVPPERDLDFPSLDAIAAAPDGRRLFIKVDYYRDIFDESTNTRTGTEPDGSVIWTMDVETGAYTGSVEVPFFEYTYTEKNRRFTARMLYSMLGVIRNGRAFLSFPVENGYSLLILDLDSPGGEQRQGFIQVSNEELQFNAFNLSDEGILSALLVDDWQVKVVWWRTDKLISPGEDPL